MRRAHLVIGVLGILVFLATGRYMRWIGVIDMDPESRMLFRSRHVYILFASLLNLSLGIYLQPAIGIICQRLQFIGSLLVALSPVLLLAAFVWEPTRSIAELRFSPLMIIGLFVGILLHLASHLLDRQVRD